MVCTCPGKPRGAICFKRNMKSCSLAKERPLYLAGNKCRHHTPDASLFRTKIESLCSIYQHGLSLLGSSLQVRELAKSTVPSLKSANKPGHKQRHCLDCSLEIMIIDISIKITLCTRFEGSTSWDFVDMTCFPGPVNGLLRCTQVQPDHSASCTQHSRLFNLRHHLVLTAPLDAHALQDAHDAPAAQRSVRLCGC